MADINVECINPFLMAATSIMRSMCQMELQIGKPYVKTNEFGQDSVLIMIGVTGEMRGQVILAFTTNSALHVVSKMAMMQIDEMNEIATSAVSELGNMIMGNAATILSTKGIGIDITPPTVCCGSLRINSSYTKNVCIPLAIGNQVIMELDISVKSED